MKATALIAEDEPLLAAALQAELARAWPALEIVAVVGHGAAAVTQALARRPQVLFLDIRMPGQTGLDAAAELADDWPGDTPFPAIVFVTAYDQYAVQAFEAQAVDYLLKPVQPERLARTVQRLQALLALRDVPPTASLDAAVAQLRGLLENPAARGTGASPEPPLRFLTASVGATTHLVPVDSVVYLEAADKYVRVVTHEGEWLVRTPLKDLLPRLDPTTFWQIHRGTAVRASAIASVTRQENGKLSLALRDRAERLAVSRLHEHLFRAL